jgi:predicted DNA-binding ribbon-helix-helix protein
MGDAMLMERTGRMAKPKGRPKRSERDDMTVRLERRLAMMLKSIADYRGITAAELLSDLAREPLTRAYGQMLRELNPKGGN